MNDPDGSEIVCGSVFDLGIPLLSHGISRDLLCAGENSQLHILCYSTNMGEKHGLHAHVQEEHAFIVLHGQARFSDLTGKLPVLSRNQGIWLPKGCFYEFINPGSDPLVLLRFGALQHGADKSQRIDPDGNPILGRGSRDPELARPEAMEDRFFGR